ncbi:MAG: hypothetical protein ACLTYW_10430 [Collinsella sp.]
MDPETGKLSAPAEPLNELAQRFDYVLAEADGSKRLPLKAHAAWEPVIPPPRQTLSGSSAPRGWASPSRSCPPPRALLRALRLRAHRRHPERVAQVLNAELRMLNLNNAASCSTKSTRSATPRWPTASRQLSTAPSSPPSLK